MATLARPALKRQSPTPNTGVYVDRIAGSYRRIPAAQLMLAWWLYRTRHITKRQLRVWFAAQEMAERRRYTKAADGAGRQKRKPSYGIDELQKLVGGRGSQTARAELAADARELARLGLVTIAEHTIVFAQSIEHINIEDASGLQDALDTLPHQNRVVPAPRRVLRALAGGMTTGMTAVVLATLIRSLFWHKQEGRYRVDGRTKREWVAGAFGISPRSITEARARLIEIGWLVPLDTPQWMLNRHGAHDRINTDWSAGDCGGAGEANDNAGGLASPRSNSPGSLASPDQNRSTSSSRNQETRTSALTRAGPSGGSTCSPGRGRRHPKRDRSRPSMRDVQGHDLRETGRLLQLYEQAVGLGLASDSEAGRLEFVAMAERARRRGRRPGALFLWLLRERKTEFVTHSDEEEAARRLREHREGSAERPDRAQDADRVFDQHKDDTTVRVCLHVARQYRIDDPYHVARRYKGWTRAQWEEAQHRFKSRQWTQLPVPAQDYGD